MLHAEGCGFPIFALKLEPIAYLLRISSNKYIERKVNQVMLRIDRRLIQYISKFSTEESIV